MSAAGAEPPAPYPLALVICDGVHIDPLTRKYSLLGTFSALRGAEFPMVVEKLVVYLAMTDVRGVIPFELRIVRVSPDDASEWLTFTTQGELYSDDPLAVAELALTVHGVQFPTSGEYRIQFFACDQFVMERRLSVIERT